MRSTYRNGPAPIMLEFVAHLGRLHCPALRSTDMRLEITPANRLSSKHTEEWLRLQASNPSLESPLFDVRLYGELAESRPDVEVAIVRDAGQYLGFFPFVRDAHNVGTPAAGPLADLQGLICGPDFNLDALWLLKECGLTTLKFSSVLVTQPTFQPYVVTRSLAPYVDISGGFAVYRELRSRSGSDELSDSLRKLRKLEREHGPVQFVHQTSDHGLLDLMLTWKSQALASKGEPNLLEVDWIRNFLHRVVDVRHERAQGMLSVLSVHDEPVAIALNIRSIRILQGWVTAFNPQFARYSPGSLLFVKIVQSGRELGLHRLEMGRGEEPFKRRFQTGYMELGEGLVDLRLVRQALARGFLRAKSIVRETPLREPARRLIRSIQSASKWFRGTGKH